MENFFYNKRILITGASGSIGSALIFKLLKMNCKVIRAFSNDENGLYELSEKIRNFNKNANLTFQMAKNKSASALPAHARLYCFQCGHNQIDE